MSFVVRDRLIKRRESSTTIMLDKRSKQSMSSMQGTPGMGQELERYLLSIRGTLSPPTLEAARKVHNETAGAPQNVAAARSLGDLSHMVYVPLGGGEPEAGAGEFLIMDIWNSMDGLNQFFANKQVQE